MNEWGKENDISCIKKLWLTQAWADVSMLNNSARICVYTAFIPLWSSQPSFLIEVFLVEMFSEDTEVLCMCILHALLLEEQPGS